MILSKDHLKLHIFHKKNSGSNLGKNNFDQKIKKLTFIKVAHALDWFDEI